MDLLHVALTSGSEERADAFYVGLLGLKKAGPKILPTEIGRTLFGIDRELTVINYTGGSAHFEVFVASTQGRRIEHMHRGGEPGGVLAEMRGLASRDHPRPQRRLGHHVHRERRWQSL